MNIGFSEQKATITVHVHALKFVIPFVTKLCHSFCHQTLLFEIIRAVPNNTTKNDNYVDFSNER